ncbi:hypothetical protein YC2023_075964 [Brassica napus]
MLIKEKRGKQDNNFEHSGITPKLEPFREPNPKSETHTRTLSKPEKDLTFVFPLSCSLHDIVLYVGLLLRQLENSFVDFYARTSKSVNGTNAGRKSLPEDKGPDVPADASSSKDKAPEPNLVLLDKNQSTVSDLQKEDARYLEKRDAALALCRAKSDRTRKLAASQQSPYTANNTAKVTIPNKKLYPSYNPFAPIDKKKLKELADWLKTCP